MKKKKIIIWVLSVVGILAIAGGAAAFLLKDKTVASVGNEMEEISVTVQKAKEQELIETILVTGEIVPEGEQKVFLNPEQGEISEYKVEENQTVKAGDPLFVYDSSKLDTEITRATRERDLIQVRAKTEQNQIAALGKRIEEAKKNLAAQKSKPKVETKTDSDADPEAEMKTETEPAEEIPVEDVNQLTSEKVQMELQYENTKSEVAAANERITELTNQKKEMTVVSKISGIIVKINKNVAATETGATEPVIHIISNQPYKVIGTMSEFDAVKIQQGQEVIVRPKVFKDREWKGVVESVSHFPNDDGSGGGEFAGMGGANVTMYPFKVGITDDTSELRHGFHVSLEVRIPGAEILPVIPHTAIMDEGGVAVVYVLADGLLQRREVQTGSMNDEFIQVTEGVTKDELIVLTPYEGLYDGMEVTSFDEVE
ncbi:efflux RND transporter periplasmic adaptor subunit [Ferdinandcohnia sp. Marseille-Q9671]